MAETPVPVKGSPKDFFLYLARTALLYFGAAILVMLLFIYIDLLVEPGMYATDKATSIRWALAVLMVASPVFFAVSWFVTKDLAKYPQKFELKVRKWTTHLTLFLAAAFGVMDLIYLIYDYLEGDFLTKTILKSLTVLAVAGTAFGYYLWDLRRTEVQYPHSGRVAVPAFSIVILASIITGFFLTGTPGYRRDKKFDEMRISDLQMIKRVVGDYYKDKDRLPETLKVLQNTSGWSSFTTRTDPQTKVPYEYRVLSKDTFELCATFKTKDNPNSWNSSNGWGYIPGRTCFTKSVEKRGGAGGFNK